MVLLLPIRTLVFPLMSPRIRTMADAVLVSATAATSSARFVTVVTLPLEPPVVLLSYLVSFRALALRWEKSDLPSVLSCKAYGGDVC